MKSPKVGSSIPAVPVVIGDDIATRVVPYQRSDLEVTDVLTPGERHESLTAVSNAVTVLVGTKFPDNLPRELSLFLAQNGRAYAEIRGAGNPYVVPVGSRLLDNLIRQHAKVVGIVLRKKDIGEINDMLQANAEMAGLCKRIWLRVAPVPGGVEIDLGDDTHDRIRITAGRVETIKVGSESRFFRTTTAQAMTRPAQQGDLKLLNKYLNLDDASILLFKAWISYTLAHPKVETSNFVILVLQGGQGSGKSALSKLILKLIDPSQIGVQVMPKNDQDFAIASQNAHVLCFDNLRDFSKSMADKMCVAATGGALAARQLYTDADQQILFLHVALVLNGIHSFIEQPDLAQRCLPLRLKDFADGQRKSEVDLAHELESDLPAIQRGLFDLIASVYKHLPTAKATDPERMIEFSTWLAAMEMSAETPTGVYQSAYSEALNEGQRDSLLDNPLAAAVLDLAEREMGPWSGTPAELLTVLNQSLAHGMRRSKEWPDNPIALSKRLVPLIAGLKTQGVSVETVRAKHRRIVIKKLGEKT